MEPPRKEMRMLGCSKEFPGRPGGEFEVARSRFLVEAGLGFRV